MRTYVRADGIEWDRQQLGRFRGLVDGLVVAQVALASDRDGTDPGWIAYLADRSRALDGRHPTEFDAMSAAETASLPHAGSSGLGDAADTQRLVSTQHRRPSLKGRQPGGGPQGHRRRIAPPATCMCVGGHLRLPAGGQWVPLDGDYDSDEHLEELRRLAVSCLDAGSGSSQITPELARELVRRSDAGTTGWQVFAWLNAELEQNRL